MDGFAQGLALTQRQYKGNLDVKSQSTYFPRCHLAPIVFSPSPAQTSTWTMLWRCFFAESFRVKKISHSFDNSTYCSDVNFIWLSAGAVSLNLFTAYTLDCGIFLKQTPDLQVAGLRCSAHLREVYQTAKRREIQCNKLLIILFLLSSINKIRGKKK